MSIAKIAPLILGLALLTACESHQDAPTTKGVCWHLADTTGGKFKFNQLAVNQPDLEHCAAELEKMRISFLSLGAGQREVVGAYQGQFLFLKREGVFTSQTYEGFHYPFLLRTGDGRLATPGAMPRQ